MAGGQIHGLYLDGAGHVREELRSGAAWPECRHSLLHVGGVSAPQHADSEPKTREFRTLDEEP